MRRKVVIHKSLWTSTTLWMPSVEMITTSRICLTKKMMKSSQCDDSTNRLNEGEDKGL